MEGPRHLEKRRGDPFYGPEAASDADRVRCGRAYEWCTLAIEALPDPGEGQYEYHKRNLPHFDTQIEQEQREDLRAFGQANIRQSARKSKTVDKAKSKGDDPGLVLCERVLPAHSVYCFSSQ